MNKALGSIPITAIHRERQSGMEGKEERIVGGEAREIWQCTSTITAPRCLRQGDAVVKACRLHRGTLWGGGEEEREEEKERLIVHWTSEISVDLYHWLYY